MIKNPTPGQTVFVDYDNQGYERLAIVLAGTREIPRRGNIADVKFIDDGSRDQVWCDFLHEVIYCFTGPLMVTWRNGFGSEPV